MNQGKKRSIGKLLYLSNYIKPHNRLVLIMLVSLVFTSLSVLGLGKSLEYVIDVGLSQNNISKFNQSMMVVVLIIIVLAAGTCARFYSVTLLSERIVADLRQKIYDHILILSPSFFETQKTGSLLSRLTTDTTLLQSILSTHVSMAMRNILLLIGSMIMLFSTNTKLTMLMLCIIPLVVIPIIILGKKLKVYSKLSQEKIGEVAAHAEETLFGIKVVQSYNREKYESKMFHNKVVEVINAALVRIKVRSILTVVVVTLVFGGIGCVLWVGGIDVLEGKITAGELSSFIFLSVVAASSVGAITDTTSELQKAGAAVERIREFLTVDTDIKNIDEPQFINAHKRGNIQFEDVSFFYQSRKDKAVLNKVSFEIKPNQVTALVGSSGSGKSTILQLLMRFYDCQSGVISFDRVDIKNICLADLRNQFSYVSQEPVIFSNTIYENIAYGCPSANKEDVFKVAYLANASEFIDQLPEKMDSFIGEKGVRLSGGQKQRIAIARALLQSPRILLLDEATSSLDTANEKEVSSNIQNMMANKTTVVVAHRLSTVKNADKILVFKNGKIVQSGRHDELIAEGGEYKRLVKAQFSD